MFRVINETAPTAGCPWTNWTDEELLLEYRCTGVREAFDEIVRRHERELYRYLYHYLGNAANADDVFQKTFLAVLKECSKFESGREFHPWLYKIATNKAVDHIRKAKQCTMISIDDPQGNNPNAYAVTEEIVGRESEPFEDQMDKEIACKVREAVDSLPEQMRQAVYMVYFQGLSYREAADAVGVHLSTVALRLKHAVQKLNFLLKSVG